jgi:hypothetical protein
LDKEEIGWSLKSKSIQREEGNNNTIFFCRIMLIIEKNVNTIWEIGTHDGSKARTFKDIANAGKAHFQNLFKDL